MDQGLTALSGAGGLPATLAGAQSLDQVVRQIVAELGSPAQTSSLLGALTQLTDGTGRLQKQLGSATSATSAVAGELGTAAGQAGPLKTASTSSADLAAQVIAADCGSPAVLPAADCDTLRQAQQKSTTTAAGLSALGDALTKASGSLDTISTGLGQAEKAAADLTLGLADATAGLQKIRFALSSAGSPDSTRKGVLEGLDALVTGLSRQVSGVTGLAGASGQAAGKAGLLSSGSSQVAAGAAAAGKAGELAAGTDKVAQGSQQVATGVQSGSAAAGQIAAGTRTSADGAAKASSGAQQLHEKGTAPLTDGIVTGSATAAQVAALFTAMDASAADSLPYGAPAGAGGSAMWNLAIDPAAAADPAGAPARTLGDGALIAIALALLFGSVAVAGVVRRGTAGPTGR